MMDSLWPDPSQPPDGASDPSLSDVLDRMHRAGVRTFYLKPLAANDNSKNQIYVSRSWETLNFLPVESWSAEGGGKHSDRVKGKVRLEWLSPGGTLCPAPDTQLILYPQYPEIRLSGFLVGAPGAPQFLGERGEGRLLILGVADNRRIVGYAALPDSRVRREYDGLDPLPRIGVFRQLSYVNGQPTTETRSLLLQQLRAIHDQGWIDSLRLYADGRRAACDAKNCGGLTLEAELGIPMNSNAGPDIYDWEVKCHGVRSWTSLSGSRITLMTPDPTSGLLAEDIVDFVRRHGTPDGRKQDRKNFNIVHKVGETHDKSGLTLRTEGLDVVTLEWQPTACLELTRQDGVVEARWRFTDLLKHWQAKHIQAAYVPSQCRTEPSRQYRYGPRVRLGMGTSFKLYLQALLDGEVVYDPGINVERISSSKPRPHWRHQWRILPTHIDCLYDEMLTEELPQP